MPVWNIHVLPGKKVPEGAVYIGRANARLGLKASPWANPFVLRDFLDSRARTQVLEQYEEWLVGQVNQGRVTRAALAALAGKPLVCFCAPLPCHGQVIERFARLAADPQASWPPVAAPVPRPAPKP